MFEMGRELKKLFAADGPKDGFAHGDPSLLELLDLRLLRREAQEADIAAGRVSARDPAQRLIEASVVWRELARRTGDAAALRKSASAAELSARRFEKEGRAEGVMRARSEQAFTAMLGADLFGEDGLNAAAEYALIDIAPHSPLARGALARLSARKPLVAGGLDEALEAAARFDKPLAAIDAKSGPAYALAATRLRCERAEMLIGCGSRLHDPLLFKMALSDLDTASAGLDPAYRPLSWLRVQELRAAALIGIGEATGESAPLIEGASLLTTACQEAVADHSPLDWARLHNGLGLALQALGEAGISDKALDKAVEIFGSAMKVLEGAGAAQLRACVAQNRAAAIVRRAEVRGDIYALDEAEIIFRGELGGLGAQPDPVAWATLQLNLARIYQARATVSGVYDKAQARAGDALAAAQEVFAEHGLRTLALMAQGELERLKDSARRAHRT